MHSDPDGPAVQPQARGFQRLSFARWTVSHRLMGAIAVPILLLVVISTGVTSNLQRDVERAEQISDELDVIERLVELRSAIFEERVAAELLVPARRPPDDLLRSIEFGARIAADAGSLADRTDAALAALDPADRPFTSAELASMRSDRASWQDTLTQIRQEVGPFYDRAAEAMRRGSGTVRETAVALGDESLIAAGTMFERSLVLPNTAGELMARLTDLWIAEPAGRVVLQSEVADQAARFDEVARRFDPSVTDPDGPAGRAWEAVQLSDDLTDLLDRTRSGELTDPARAPLEPLEVGSVLIRHIDWLVQVDELPMITARNMSEVAEQVAADARREALTTAALLLLAVGTSVAAAMLLARSIIVPVLRLTDRAERVGAGRLDIDLAEHRGPPEVVRASRAIDDVIDNLLLLEQKSHALAECDFHHPSLRRSLPGLLGAELQRSVRVLSGSIVEREQLQSRLVHEATHDSLTGLANRAELVDKLSLAQRHPSSRGRQTAVLFIDLDNFKRANDRYGHAAGDELLRVVAERMREVVPPRCTLARFGGDEFVAILPSVEDHEEPVALAHRLVEAVCRPVDVDGLALNVGASAGVALSGLGRGTPSLDPLDLLRRADLAVYSAKQSSSRSVVLYDEALDRQVTHQEDVEDALGAALSPDADELRLVFQPIISTESGELHGIESLVRWDRPGHGRVPPDAFVPIAERSGLIVELDRWVMRAALRQIEDWSTVATLGAVPVSVNVSGRSLLDPTFVDGVTDALTAASVAPDKLKIEITETALVTDIELAAEQLQRVRAIGVRVVIDDFGTGYTSVAHLRSMPVDELKIDSSFVQRLPDEENRVLIRMIHQLANHLDIPTVAEGVETAEQIGHLRAIGCDSLQGYLFSPPLEADELGRWVRSRLGGWSDGEPGVRSRTRATPQDVSELGTG